MASYAAWFASTCGLSAAAAALSAGLLIAGYTSICAVMKNDVFGRNRSPESTFHDQPPRWP